jgi:hypothetical protein
LDAFDRGTSTRLGNYGISSTFQKDIPKYGRELSFAKIRVNKKTIEYNLIFSNYSYDIISILEPAIMEMVPLQPSVQPSVGVGSMGRITDFCQMFKEKGDMQLNMSAQRSLVQHGSFVGQTNEFHI